MLFALVIEREPMKWSEVPAGFRDWAQTAGVIAAIGLLIWTINWAVQNWNRGTILPREPRGWAVLSFMGLAAAGFVFVGLTFLGRAINIRALAQMTPVGNAVDPTGKPLTPTAGDWAFAIAGIAALIAVSLPILFDIFTRFRWGRIWALAKLSLKEAIRSRVVLIFGLIAIVFLFAEWFVPYKPEDQLRNYVAVIYKSMPILFLVTASLLGAFSIPADIRSQTIHTVVTKPVERFEIVLGRFLGYAILITVALAIVASLSLVYVVRGIHPDAERESFKARVPIYGQLSFEGTAGESVGRVWSYRKYIGGRTARDPGKEQFAVWSYDELPGEFATRTQGVPFELTFDIYRMTKGVENRGVFCNFVFADGRFERGDLAARLARFRDDRKKYQDQVTKQARAAGANIGLALQQLARQIENDYPAAGSAALALMRAHRADEGAGEPADEVSALREVENLIIVLHGVYEPGSVEVKDYHTQNIEVPAPLFRRLFALDAEAPRVADPQGIRSPMLRVWTSVDSTGVNSYTNAPQMVGMARADLYLLAAEKPFWQNFYKGIIGLWCTFILALGIAVPLSTYLSGVITWLCVMFLFGAGVAREFVRNLAEGKLQGGGPMESIVRIFSNTFHSVPLEDSPGASTVRTVDAVYQFLFKLVYNILPDLRRFYLEKYVANGFDISWGRMLFLDCFLPMVAYLVPWLILGYYLIKYREIANPN